MTHWLDVSTLAHKNSPMKYSDFILSKDELDQLNRLLTARAKAHRDANEDSWSSVTVVFEFSSVLGRSIGVQVDGTVTITYLDKESNGQW
ncbi:hypothetical protein [Variovorax sp. LT1P1]|uniref:hypothetical protein n=1 Tax=Variovorax sp. LT1P1 TaxID=3443730 RepID=UPI003F49380E